MLRIKKCGHKELHDYYKVMKSDFEKSELPPEIVFQKALLQNQIEFLLIVDDTVKVTIAYAVVCPKSMYGYGLLMYFAVMPWYRGKGLGTDALRLINKRYNSLRGMLLEVTNHPDKATGDRRIRFYQREGYEIVRCGDYTLFGVPARIMVRQKKGLPDPGPVMHRIMPEIYTHLFSETTVRKNIIVKPYKKPRFWQK